MGGPGHLLKPPVLTPTDAAVEGELLFGPYRLDTGRRQLFSGDISLRLGSRAMTILMALAENAGRLMTKEELVRIAWPETFVEEVNLRVHLSAIRRALGDTSETPRYIANVSGRGYRFIAPINGQIRLPPEPPAIPVTPAPPLPFYTDDLIGRDQALQTVSDMLLQHRLVTLVGPGGIGKTALAAAVGRSLSGRFSNGIGFIDLAFHPDQSALDQQLARLLSRSDGARLLVLDSCDQMIEEAARLAEDLAQRTEDLHIIATSREPLRAASERVVRLPPLNVPDGGAITLQEALKYSAIGMLVDRLDAGGSTVDYSDRDVQRLVAISHKLDGLPLAIEMAAAHIQVFGLPEVEGRLKTGMEFLADTRRSATPRHRTLRDLMAPDHVGLAPDERLLLERLAIFPIGFDLVDATAIASETGIDDRWIVSALGGLVAKSQLSVTRIARGISYRLPRPLRTFALEQLMASPDYCAVALRHAELVLGRVRVALANWAEQSRAEWLEVYSELAEQVCEVLAWCFSGDNERRIGAELLALSTPILLRAGHFSQLRTFAAFALAEDSALPPEARLLLLLQLATTTEDKTGPTDTETSYLLRAGRLRRAIAAPWADAKLLVAASALALRKGRSTRALALAQRGMERALLARRSNMARVARRIAAEAAHYAGDFPEAARLAQPLLAGGPWSLPAPFTLITSPPESALRVIEARRLWLSGKAEQARRLMFEAVNFAGERGPWALCEALGLGLCPLLLWLGEDDRVSTHIDQLDRESGFAGLPHWQSWVVLYRQVQAHITMREGRRSESAIAVRPINFLQAEIWVTLSGSMRGISLCPAAASGWCQPEFIRARANATIAAGNVERGAADLNTALHLARDMGALAWELRAAMSLARLRLRTRPKEAHDLLAGVYDRFEEGHDTSDLLAAKALLRRLQNAPEDHAP